MSDAQAAFEQFSIQRKQDLRRIANSTQGEHQFSDVVNEAWIVAYDLAARKNIAIDFLNRSFQDLLISHLYQHLVRYAEQNVRRALRLDHAAPSEDRDNEPHSVAAMLVSDEGQHPLVALVEQETESARDEELSVHHSQASAYVSLLRHFNNKMQAVADYFVCRSRTSLYRSKC